MTTKMTVPKMDKKSIPTSAEGSISCDSSTAEMERKNDIRMRTLNMD